LLTILSCGDALDYSLYETDLPSEATGLTAKHLEALQMLPSQEKFKVAVIADTHNHYVDLDNVVRLINSRNDIAFVIVVGDVTNIGLMNEFLWFHDIARKLTVPYLTVMGNHDSLSKGKKIYNKMYGQFNYSFDYSGTQFIILNSNQRDFPNEAPDLNWLQSQLQESYLYDNVIVFAHVPPHDHRDWIVPQSPIIWKYLMERHNVKFSVSGHKHIFSLWAENNVNYVTVGSVKDINYGIISFSKDGVGYERCNYTCEVQR
jgi:predicted phosphodiesterase